MAESTQPTPSGPAVAEPPAKAAANPARPPAKLDRLPPYRVLLHNDDHNDFQHVIRAVVEIAWHPVPKAVEITMEAHKSGVALVTICHQEKAELLREQFQSKGLTCTIEKAE